MKEKIHFCEIAYGSLMEAMCQLILAVDLEMIPRNKVDEIRPLFDELSRQLSAYRRSMSKELFSKP
ncbi:MAG: four helix bundle protein [Candidatus Homeothermus sp.]|nr:four helix bundle protein [Candidatus Homeothermus sp.]